MINWHTSETGTIFGGLQACTGLACFGFWFFFYLQLQAAYYFYDVVHFFTFFFKKNLENLQTI